ncbi:MAG: ABC transporter substrate-binding protein [Sphingobacteriia bacterium]|nr:ABC transporter substrate-binding protein [Sphingobacteriia bacterium]
MKFFKTIFFITYIILLNLTVAESSQLKKVAIANYGIHSSLEDTIFGIKNQLTKEGFIEGKNIEYKILHVNFEQTLIPQMLNKLLAYNPDVIVSITTPVTQSAKRIVKNKPLVFASITDPVSAGILDNKNTAKDNITGAAEKQNLSTMLEFIKTVLPSAHRIGVLYALNEDNDKAMIEDLELAAKKLNMEVVKVGIDQQSDIPKRINILKNKVDLIYVSTSGPIQPALSVITSFADKNNIPVFNADAEAIKKHKVLGSYSVSFTTIGQNAGKIISKILNGQNINSISPIYPSKADHIAILSKKKMDLLKITPDLEALKEFNTEIIE